MAEEKKPAVFDPLDMNNYKVEKLPKMQKSKLEVWMARLGGPLALIAFVWICWFSHIGFIDNLGLMKPFELSNVLAEKAKARLDILGIDGFVRANYAMLGIFVASLILWITEAIPNYLTSLVLILGVVLFNVTSQETALHQLGHPVMWLNILSFVLASMLVKTRFAKRLALAFVIKFGKSAKGVLWSFLLINLVLSMFISATTVKATIMLPIFMVICAIYGASNGTRNNFGRNLVIQNLFQVNIGANAFYTGSGAHLLAISLIAGFLGSCDFGYSDWLIAVGPMSVIILVVGLLLGMYVFFPMKKEEQVPQIEGGLDRLREELKAMGKMSVQEWKAVGIFLVVLFLWITKGTFHNIDETIVALIGAVLALIPGIGVVKWNDVDIPWHLMLFSAGAYVLGSGLNATGLPNTMVNAAFNSLGIGDGTPYWVLYVILTFLMMYSGLVFQSKTIRTMVFVPIALGVEQRFGFPPMSLALPVSMLIEHCYVLPFNSKPAALLYTTNQYSMTDAFKYGITMMTFSWLLILLFGETLLKWLHITPGLF
ncbi:MAG: DASS family sodium-coupled anion symporter [Bacteroidales bacterium]|nr:DASS family sodium-coupled anion symporter [Bacteroidales bacterium]